MSKNIHHFPTCRLKIRYQLKSYKYIVHIVVFTGDVEQSGMDLP